mgnify:CR=1 FL=1
MFISLAILLIIRSLVSLLAENVLGKGENNKEFSFIEEGYRKLELNKN